MTGVIQYGMGNVGSILNMLLRIGTPARLVSRAEDFTGVDRLILPGVGTFDAGMERLHTADLIPVLNDLVLVRKIPVLGICLGMQLLGRRSEEGSCAGLGWIGADVVRFKVDAPDASPRLTVPHMGWSQVAPGKDARLFRSVPMPCRFYFVHSYHMVCDDSADVAATAEYGGPVTASVARGNVFGTQFHPEKSHKFGMQLLRAFSEEASP